MIPVAFQRAAAARRESSANGSGEGSTASSLQRQGTSVHIVCKKQFFTIYGVYIRVLLRLHSTDYN